MKKKEDCNHPSGTNGYCDTCGFHVSGEMKQEGGIYGEGGSWKNEKPNK